MNKLLSFIRYLLSRKKDRDLKRQTPEEQENEALRENMRRQLESLKSKGLSLPITML